MEHSQPNEKQTDLIRRVQVGEGVAYEELVALFRPQALEWATRVVGDPHLAEDVTQDAMVRMKTKIGSLQDPSKFTSWFKLMVRRLALNQLRGKVRQVMSYGEVPESMEQLEQLDDHNDRLQQEEMGELLRNSLRPLSEQARSLLTTYATEDATPEELASRFGMNKSNVYNIISRSRSKANDERFRLEVERHLKRRRQEGKTVECQLVPPVHTQPYSLMSAAIWEVLRASDDMGYTLTDVLGISGEAFRLNVAVNCHWQGISTFDWSYSAYRMMERLGVTGHCYGRPGRKAVTPEDQIRLLAMIQDCIDSGRPVIVFNMIINEFGYIYGYDDAA